MEDGGRGDQETGQCCQAAQKAHWGRPEVVTLWSSKPGLCDCSPASSSFVIGQGEGRWDFWFVFWMLFLLHLVLGIFWKGRKTKQGKMKELEREVEVMGGKGVEGRKSLYLGFQCHQRRNRVWVKRFLERLKRGQLDLWSQNKSISNCLWGPGWGVGGEGWYLT